MEVWAVVETLGELSLVEVFEAYDDVPILLACQDAGGQTYLALWVEELSNAWRFLLAPLSADAWARLRSGVLGLRDAILSAEGGVVWSVTVPFVSATGTAVRMPCDQIPEGDLPAPHVLLASGA